MGSKRVVVSAALVAGIAVGAWLMFQGGKLAPAIGLPSANAPVTFYRWTDAEGAKHLSSDLPPPGVRYETTVQDGVLTRMDPPKPPEPQESAPAVGNPLSVYSPGAVSKLMRDTHNAVQAVQQAREQQKRQIEQ